jgi:hypothetical protein
MQERLKASGLGDYEAVFRDLTAGTSASSNALRAMAGRLAEMGIEVLTNASGISGKIRLPNGQVVDVIQGAASDHPKWQWMTGSPEIGGAMAQGIARSIRRIVEWCYVQGFKNPPAKSGSSNTRKDVKVDLSLEEPPN